MLSRLDELADYKYYFQFTLTCYGKDVESNLPSKTEQIIPTFQALSEKIGSKRVIWRYDPILFTAKYNPEYHLKAFEQMAAAFRGYTEKCVISFVNTYAKNIVMQTIAMRVLLRTVKNTTRNLHCYAGT